MTPTMTATEPLDQIDPWGLGVTAAERMDIVEVRQPVVEPAGDAPTAIIDVSLLLRRGSLSAKRPFGAPAAEPGGLGVSAGSASSRPSLSETLPATPEVPLDAPLMLAAPIAPAAPLAPEPASLPTAPPLPLTMRSLAPAVPPPVPGPVLRLPFPADRLGIMALFGAVIVAQAFYIWFSLTGEAAARPEPAVTTAPATASAASAPVVPPVVVPGVLRVDTGSAVADLRIDGVAAGKTPFVATNLAPGPHAVRVAFSGGAVVERTVTVAASETVALVLEAPAMRAAVPAGPVSGWVRIEAPFELEVFEDGQLLGTTASDRIMMPAGGRVLELVNSSLGFRSVVKAAVVPGKVASLMVESPRVPVAINAQPWAEVVIDGRVHGDTPMANLMLPIGVHRIVLRHPDLGERVETVTVRAGVANRVSVDLRR